MSKKKRDLTSDVFLFHATFDKLHVVSEKTILMKIKSHDIRLNTQLYTYSKPCYMLELLQGVQITYMYGCHDIALNLSCFLLIYFE